MVRRIALLTFAALVGCSVLAPASDVEVRIRNASGTAFDRVVVTFPEQTEDYGAVPAAGSSEYRVVERAYRYAHIAVTANGMTAVLQPTDYVGEKLLDGGRYTYALSWLETTGQPRLGLTLERE